MVMDGKSAESRFVIDSGSLQPDLSEVNPNTDAAFGPSNFVSRRTSDVSALKRICLYGDIRGCNCT